MLTTFSLCSYPQTFFIYNKHFLSLKTNNPPHHLNKQQLLTSTHSSTYFGFNPLRVGSIEYRGVMNINKQRGFGAVCYSAPLSPPNLQWISTIAFAVLMFARSTGIQKSFLVPIFALQAPASIISWIKGEYGIWTAFLALLLRLFFRFPGELELPFMALLIVLVTPYQVMNLRGKQESVILSLTIAGYLAFQHFSRAGSLRKAFDQGSIIATIAIVCVLVVPCLLLIRI